MDWNLYGHRRIRKITPAAALVLAAEFDRAHRRRLLGRRGVINAEDWDPGVARSLIEIGFLAHLHADLPDYQQLQERTPQVTMLPMLTGDRSEPEEIERLSQGVQRLMGSIVASNVSHAIYNGLIEAMDNCASHAYPNNHSFRYPTEWG